jgi:TonB family protein
LPNGFEGGWLDHPTKMSFRRLRTVMLNSRKMLSRIRTTRFLVVALGACFFVNGVASAQSEESTTTGDELYREQIHSLAGRLLMRAEKAKCRPDSCTILVENFTTPSGSTSRLGIQLGDSMSADLLSQGHGIHIVERSRLQDYLVRERIPSSALKDREAARWLATEFQANAVLVGAIKPVGDSFNLMAQLFIISPDWVSTQEIMQIAVPEPGEAFAPFEPYDGEPKVPGAPRSVKGAGVPACTYCPPPQYSSVARKVKFTGTVVLAVTVSEDGRATDVHVLKGVPFGLNEQAIHAVNEWTFRPASASGTPVAVRVPIEMNFQLY